MTLINITGIAASVFTAISLAPQLIKVLKEKKAENISIVMLGTLFAGLSLWIVYGFMKEDWIIIISNCFSLLINIILAVVSIKYKSKK